MKHTTVQKDIPFKLSDLRKTIEGFSKRYKDLIKEEQKKSTLFYIVTNRPFSTEFVTGIKLLRSQIIKPGRFHNTITNYTGLDGSALFDFCTRLNLIDNEGDFREQRNELLFEAASIIVGDIGDTSIDALTEFIADKARPHSDGKILPEEILLRFGCTSKQSLFPAEPKFEQLANPIIRQQYRDIAEALSKTSDPVIVHAAGGVGKSILTMSLSSLLPQGSIVITYDCFGMGEYRNRSKPRHRYRDCLIQIANELAIKDWCKPLIAAESIVLDDAAILRHFLDRIDTAIKRIRKQYANGSLYIIIDAADNAEMAAKEANESCFAHSLLREKLPGFCHLVILCRTERIELLNSISSVGKIELRPFDENESLDNLRRYFMDASDEDGLEFYRLTGGNPRVQRNALESSNNNVQEVLNWLGPDGSTVETQLGKIYHRIIDNEPDEYKKRITDICYGLAILPPFVPIDVLASVAEVKRSDVTSFIADFGKAIWLTDSHVQFRDEPTETWFRDNFIGNKGRAQSYIEKLKPLAEQYVYIAQVLPILLLQSQLYNELIELALSDEYLPDINPVEKRNVQLFRLRFAFKAALQQRRYSDAARLALLAGEEAAGSSRQLDIFKKNIDLVAILLDTENVQQLAYSKQLAALWDGSESIYTASLLSSIPECIGEARSFLRSAERWLHLYIEERDKKKSEDRFSDKLTEDEIFELTWAHYKFQGIKGATEYMLAWKPESLAFSLCSRLVRRLIDFGLFSEIEELQLNAKDNKYLILGTNNELSKVGKFASESSISTMLKALNDESVKLPIITEYELRDDFVGPIQSYFEACIHYNLNKEAISNIVRVALPERASGTFGSYYRNETRQAFMRTAALRVFLNISAYEQETEWLALNLLTKEINYNNEITECKSMFSALLPWYMGRLSVISGKYERLVDVIDIIEKKITAVLNTRYKERDILLFEISYVYASLLMFISKDMPDEIYKCFNSGIQESNSIWLYTKLQLLRGAYRNDNLSCIRDELEKSIRDAIEKSNDETQIIAEDYITLSRSVFTLSRPDSSEYLNRAISILSRFGDELPSRWKAINSLAERCSSGYSQEHELAYRFIRCTEYVEENVAKREYIDRDTVFKSCTYLSAGIGLSAICRWRDRGIFGFEDQFPKVVISSIEMGYLEPEIAWPLSAYIHDNQIFDLAFACIKKTTTDIFIEAILNDMFKYSGILDLPIYQWAEIKDYLLSIKRIKSKTIEAGDKLFNDLNNYDESIKGLIKSDPNSEENKQPKMPDEVLNNIFSDSNILSDKGITETLERFNDIADHYRFTEQFWATLLSKVQLGDVAIFIKELVKVESLAFYELRRIFSYIPQTWRYRPSFQLAWQKALEQAAVLHAREVVGWYAIKEHYGDYSFNNEEEAFLIKGAINGFCQQSSINDSQGYFDFISMIHGMLSPEEAKSVLEFALSRLEMNFGDEFGDGEWNKWLIPHDDPEENVAGLIWCFLGSPNAEVRWDAVHAVKRIARSGDNLLNKVINNKNKDSAGCFGGKDLPFYNLNAHLYFLLSLKTIAQDNPESIIPYMQILIDYTNWDIPHALIQRIAINIIQRIQLCFPGTIDEIKYKELIGVEESPFPVQILDRDEYYANESKDDEDSGKFFHGYDFERYWFKPLGKVFGITEKYVARCASEVILRDWHIGYHGGYKQEPRSNIFNSRNFEEYYHSHESRPKIEIYQYYLSFHAMFVVAAKLYRNKPLVIYQGYDDVDSPWLEWISNYELTRADNYLLADARSCVPLERPGWMTKKNKEKSWRINVREKDFINSVLTSDGRICVDGFWENWQEPYCEVIWIASALVSPETSAALMTALMSYRNSHDYKLPDYNEEDWEFHNTPFTLRGWLKNENSKGGLDNFDLWAGGIRYPNTEPGEYYIDDLELTANNLNTQWFDNKGNLVIECMNWSRSRRENNKLEHKTGSKLLVTTQMAQLLCQKTGMSLIIEVQIERRIKKSYFHDVKEDDDYRAPKHMIYLFTEGGVLFNECGSIKIR